MHGQKSNNGQPKKPYKTPGLVTYGKLKDLTAGGTGSAKETSGGQASKRP